MRSDIEAGRPARLGGGAASFPASVATMRSDTLRGSSAPQQNYWIVGRGSTAPGGAAVSVRETRTNPYAASGERVVQNIQGKYAPPDPNRGLDRALTRVGGGGPNADRRTARALQRVLRGRPSGLPSGTDRNLVARVAVLMGGRESGGRSLRNVAFAPMTMDLVARGELSWQQALNDPTHLPAGTPTRLRTGGAYPMSFTGSGAGAAYREDPHAPPNAALQEQADEVGRRELAMAEHWLETENLADGGMRFRDAPHAENWVYARLVRAYGLLMRRRRR